MKWANAIKYNSRVLLGTGGTTGNVFEASLRHLERNMRAPVGEMEGQVVRWDRVRAEAAGPVWPQGQVSTAFTVEPLLCGLVLRVLFPALKLHLRVDDRPSEKPSEGQQ